ncbi:YitT family protein [Aureimonas fodinaquatilis]|uniref:YitT family protein n=1 Tax=Aureimonas fodinaquatilis TaxID=2565783 RepID=A0A5B0DXD7_9HYPH|nr:YitT family protein [Aureimonas fodinaquatilis]KAA0971156.1 YitT family protein [Aureimonas fodinaquatilis]
MLAFARKFFRSPSSKRRRGGWWSATTTHHTPVEDAIGVIAGTVLTALGITMLSHLGFMTGGTAGLAFLVFYATGWNYGLIFFVLNLPFYALAVARMGRAFSIKTSFGVGLLSLMTAFAPQFLRFDYIDPLFGAMLGGLLIGFGLLALFRHRASAGGVGILAVYLQDRFGWRAGWTQMITDLIVLCGAFVVIQPWAIVYSIIGAVVMNLFLGVNHRTDRYLAT